MTPLNYRPTMRLTRIMLFVAGGLVLAVGFSLFVLTNQTERYFAWTVGSLLTAAFLGGSYWSASVLEFLSARERLWVDSRPSIPAVAIFTFLTLIVTLLHIDKFHFDAPLPITRAGTWVWLFVYAFVPVILTILFILQARAPGADPPRRFPLASWTQTTLAVLAVLFFFTGLGLLVAPAAGTLLALAADSVDRSSGWRLVRRPLCRHRAGGVGKRPAVRACRHDQFDRFFGSADRGPSALWK